MGSEQENCRRIAEKGALDPLILGDIINPVTAVRFRRFIQPVESGCHLWMGNRNSSGYGIFYLSKALGGKAVRAHRVAWALAGLPLDPTLDLDHICRNRACVRVHPEHLEQVTNAVNVLRGEGPTAQNKRKTHCAKGHPYDYIRNGKRSLDGATESCYSLQPTTTGIVS